MSKQSPFHFCIEVVRDDGAFEAQNERVVVLRTLGQFGEERTFSVYGVGRPGAFQPGDQYELVKREKSGR